LGILTQQVVEGAGNEANMEKVREMMAQTKRAEDVKLGAELEKGVFIDFVSAYGTVFKGTIVFRRPTAMDFIRMGAVKSRLLGSFGVVDLRLVDMTVKHLAQCMAVIKSVTVKAPTWLLTDKGEIDVENIKEFDLLYHIHDKYEEWDSMFRKGHTEEPQGDSETPE
jgi:hypothetical protein